MVMRETYVGHFVNVWEVSLAGAASDELTEILDPVLPCGFQTEGHFTVHAACKFTVSLVKVTLMTTALW